MDRHSSVQLNKKMYKYDQTTAILISVQSNYCLDVLLWQFFFNFCMHIRVLIRRLLLPVARCHMHGPARTQ